MLKTIRTLVESYLLVLGISILAGLFLPQAIALAPWSTLFLQIIFFLSSLKIDFRETFREMRDWKMILVATTVMLIALPVAVRLIAPALVPDLAFPLFLLAAMPAGMTSALLVDVIGGRQSLALVLTVVTSLLAPFTVPFLTAAIYGATVTVDVVGMFRSLLLVIFVPFLLAEFVKRAAPKPVHAMASRTKPFSILLLGLLVAGAVAKQADVIRNAALSAPFRFLWVLVVLYLFFAVLHVIGYFLTPWRNRSDRASIAVCVVYMNFTLAIYLATTFFPRADVLIPLVLSIIPWATMLPMWKRIMHPTSQHEHS